MEVDDTENHKVDGDNINSRASATTSVGHCSSKCLYYTFMVASHSFKFSTMVIFMKLLSPEVIQCWSLSRRHW